jgi:hypothetical protein
MVICQKKMYARHWFRRADRSSGFIYLHTFLTGWPLVDHANGNGLDNRRSNLRLATGTQNNANRRLASNSTSGFKGVNLYKRTGRWRAHIAIHRQQKHLGYFRTAEEAARAYDIAALALFGEFALINFPKEISQ